MLTDIEIAQRANIKPIKEIAKSLGIDENDLDFYGKYKAKINDSLFEKIKTRFSHRYKPHPCRRR